MRPTGRLHLGHLVGALGNWVPLQDQYDCFYFVADWHALTSDFADTSQLTSYAYDNVADWIGAGLDPEKSTFFVQSLVPEHAELYLLLVDGRAGAVARAGADLQGAAGERSRTRTCRPSGSWATRCCRPPTWRCTTRGSCRSARIRSRTSSWRARSCGASTTSSAGREVLVEPQPLLTTFARLPGLDGDKKMSKSLGNTIHLSDSADEVKKKVMRMYTDPKRVRADIPGTVEGNPVFTYHDAFNPNTAEVEDLEGAVPRRQGRRRRGEDEAGQRAERASRSDSRAARGGAREAATV